MLNTCLYGVRRLFYTNFASCDFSDDLVCTGGASSGLFLLTSLVFNQGDYIFVEDPTYFNAIEILKNDLNMNVVVGGY